jgi:hypothetical protein
MSGGFYILLGIGAVAPAAVTSPIGLPPIGLQAPSSHPNLKVLQGRRFPKPPSHLDPQAPRSVSP